ncbi:hypothetical protein GCM10028820_05050 [Tessaracoccus terricola]
MSASTEPIVHEVHVPCSQEAAHRYFTAHLGSWWPLESHGEFGEEATVAFEGDEVVERLGREVSVWGEVLEHHPPSTLTFTWHPTRGADEATRITVTFTPDGDGTLVRLVHSGWDQIPDGAARREPYVSGWLMVLGRYVIRCS